MRIGETEEERYQRIIKEINDEKEALEVLHWPYSSIPERYRYWAIFIDKVELLRVYHYEEWMVLRTKEEIEKALSERDSNKWVAEYKVSHKTCKQPLSLFLDHAKALKSREGYPRLDEVWVGKYIHMKVLITKVVDSATWLHDEVYISYEFLEGSYERSGTRREDEPADSFMKYFTKATDRL